MTIYIAMYSLSHKYTTLTHQIKGNHRDIFQNMPLEQGYIPLPWLPDISLAVTTLYSYFPYM